MCSVSALCEWVSSIFCWGSCAFYKWGLCMDVGWSVTHRKQLLNICSHRVWSNCFDNRSWVIRTVIGTYVTIVSVIWLVFFISSTSSIFSVQSISNRNLTYVLGRFSLVTPRTYVVRCFIVVQCHDYSVKFPS